MHADSLGCIECGFRFVLYIVMIKAKHKILILNYISYESKNDTETFEFLSYRNVTKDADMHLRGGEREDRNSGLYDMYA